MSPRGEQKAFICWCLLFHYRTVKLCQDFIKEARKEESLQALYKVVAYSRRRSRSDKHGKRTKAAFNSLSRYRYGS